MVKKPYEKDNPGQNVQFPNPLIHPKSGSLAIVDKKSFTYFKDGLCQVDALPNYGFLANLAPRIRVFKTR